jgi:hypothetical protein
VKYETLANTTAVTHISIVFAVLVGLLFCYRHKRFRPWEAGTLLLVIVLWSYYGNCPLTILEQHFRDLAGQHTNLTAVGFLPYYANKLLNIGLSSRIVQRSTFFTGGVFFLASIEWISPYVNIELFKTKKTIKKLLRKKRVRTARR